MTGRTMSRAAIAAFAGLAWPYVEVAWKCRAGFETSEACVWGRSLFSLNRWLSAVVVIPATYALLMLAEWGWRRLRTGTPDR